MSVYGWVGSPGNRKKAYVEKILMTKNGEVRMYKTDDGLKYRREITFPGHMIAPLNKLKNELQDRL